VTRSLLAGELAAVLWCLIAWSDELVCALFHQLGVCTGSFSLDWAVAVARPDLGTDAQASLPVLLEQSTDAPAGRDR
jgi:hypothetical protein